MFYNLDDGINLSSFFNRQYIRHLDKPWNISSENGSPLFIETYKKQTPFNERGRQWDNPPSKLSQYYLQLFLFHTIHWGSRRSPVYHSSQYNVQLYLGCTRFPPFFFSFEDSKVIQSLSLHNYRSDEVFLDLWILLEDASFSGNGRKLTTTFQTAWSCICSTYYHASWLDKYGYHPIQDINPDKIILTAPGVRPYNDTTLRIEYYRGNAGMH